MQFASYIIIIIRFQMIMQEFHWDSHKINDIAIL